MKISQGEIVHKTLKYSSLNHNRKTIRNEDVSIPQKSSEQTEVKSF